MRQVGIPGEYFLKMAKHDYSSYRVALPREFYQNSIDAGATRIDVCWDVEKRMIEVVDDGCGMDKDTIENKLLVLGGSKKAEGSVGAFGKAKELLFFSWARYEIDTLEWKVRGSGAEYSVSKNGQRVNGTRVRIFIQPEEKFEWLVDTFLGVASRMETRTKIYVNGQRVQCEKYKGTLKKEDAWCSIYQTKCRESAYMSVRIHGIWMFDMYVGSGHGELVAELKRSSLDALTSNRDGFKSDWRQAAERLVADLLINPNSALKNRSQDVYEKISGSGKVKVSGEKAREILTEVSDRWRIGENVILLLAARLKGEGVVAADERAYTMARQMKGDGLFKFEDRLRFIGYQPDFIVKYDKAPARVSRFMETDRAKVLAKLWTETVKQVLLDNEMYLEFTAGFTFVTDEEAEFVRHGEEIYFLLNPMNVGGLSRRWILIEELKDRAIHEIAHCRAPEHDETFVNEMARLRRNTRETRSEYSKISRIS